MVVVDLPSTMGKSLLLAAIEAHIVSAAKLVEDILQDNNLLLSTPTTAMTTSAQAFRALAHARRSSRRFQPNRKIPNETLKDILKTTITSPSSFNLQPTQIILVQSAKLKKQLSDDAMLGIGNQYRTKDSSALAVFLSDLEPTKRIDRIYQLEKEHDHEANPNYLNSLRMTSSFLIGEGHAATLIKGVATNFLSEVHPMPQIEPVQSWCYKNTGLIAQTFVYAAESHNLATCIMEGYDSRRVSDILNVPDRYSIPMIVATGYEYEDPSTFRKTPRLDVTTEVVFGETFGTKLNLDSGGGVGENDNDDEENQAV